MKSFPGGKRRNRPGYIDYRFGAVERPNMPSGRSMDMTINVERRKQLSKRLDIVIQTPLRLVW